MKKVLIIQRLLLKYRVEFFEKLKDELNSRNIELVLVHGKPTGDDAKKKDEGFLRWAKKVKSKEIFSGKFRLYWLNPKLNLNDFDLIIVEQSNRQLLNYLLMLRKILFGKKFAFWGHGINRQSDEKSFVNKFKLFFTNIADWWFAYTESVKSILEKNKFPSDKITVVQNAIDTRKIRKIYSGISDEQITKIKKIEKIKDGPIGVYCGGMYREKELDFLLSSIKIVKNKIPDFQMVFIGAGIEDYKVKEASRKYDWVHYVGPKFNYEKVVYLKMADLFLMPGLVGLGILDAITTETPLITTNYQFHSPEIDYLIDKKNGIITNFNEEDYSETIIKILKNEILMEKLKHGCRESFDKYSIENMVNNFACGILTSINYENTPNT